MTTTFRIAGSFLLLLAMAACNRQGPETPRAVDDNKEVRDNEGVESVMVSPDAAKVGSEVDATGAIATEAHAFEVGQKIYISVPTRFGRRNGDKLEIFWFHDDGRSRRDEARQIAGAFTVFEFTPTDAGAYNVEVDANGKPIALVQFEVK